MLPWFDKWNVSEMTKAKCPGANTSGETDLGRNVLIQHDTSVFEFFFFLVKSQVHWKKESNEYLRLFR